ncbi:substrate-binding periplasmic protein [Bdellovibrio bacteriovorus]|uniref:substrate-binding periplasmic protein n=1 Tax=Bdellovibrio bacteriovorus TaxID=959 RepID=UPI003AA9101B
MQILKALLVIVMGFAVETAFAKDICSRQFIVGTNNYQPMYFRNSGGQAGGVDEELISAIMARRECGYNSRGMSRPVAVESLKRNQSDLILLVAENNIYSDAGADYIPLFRSVRELVVRKSKYKKGQTVADVFANKKVIFGNLIGSRAVMSESEYQLLIKDKRLIQVPDAAGVFALIQKGRTDAVIATPLLNNYLVKDLKIENDVVTVADRNFTTSLGIYVSRKRVGLQERQRLEEIVLKMKKDGTIEKILSKYLTIDQLSSVSYE